MDRYNCGACSRFSGAESECVQMAFKSKPTTSWANRTEKRSDAFLVCSASLPRNRVDCTHETESQPGELMPSLLSQRGRLVSPSPC